MIPEIKQGPRRKPGALLYYLSFGAEKLHILRMVLGLVLGSGEGVVYQTAAG